MSLVRTRLLVGLAAGLLVLTGVVGGCTRVTGGSVVQTTEPGPPLSSAPPRPTAAPPPRIPSLPLPTRPSDLPEVPPPANALTMTCAEYLDLDEATQYAVIREVLEKGDTPLGPLGRQRESLTKTLVDAVCPFMPQATVNQAVLGG